MSLIKKLLRSELSLYIVCLMTCFGIFLVKFPTSPPQIPLFYSQISSEKQITDLVYIWILPLLSGLIIIVNKIVLTGVFFADNHFVNRIVHFVNISTILICSFIFIRIITLIS